MRRIRCIPLAAIASAVVLFTSCDAAPGVDLVADAPPFASSGRSLLVCRGGQEKVLTARVGTAGATFGGHGVLVSIPAGALTADTDFEVRIPATTFVEVEIKANGQDHFEFEKPVTVGLDYTRCGNAAGLSLSVWHINPQTKELLEYMGGVNDPMNQRVIFSTMHLSGYAIAN